MLASPAVVDHADPEAAGQLHHVEVAVPPAELDGALEWWGWLLAELGYGEKNDWAGGRSWLLGPTYVVLKAADEEGAVERRAPVGTTRPTSRGRRAPRSR